MEHLIVALYSHSFILQLLMLHVGVRSCCHEFSSGSLGLFNGTDSLDDPCVFTAESKNLLRSGLADDVD